MRWEAMFVLLILIPSFMGFMTMPAKACAGGDPGATYLDESLSAKAHEYKARTFEIDGNRWVDFSLEEKGTIYVLTGENMGRFEDGKNFTYEIKYDGNGGDPHGKDMDAGTYWAVLDNRDGNETVTTSVKIYTPAEKCGDQTPFDPLPAFQFELMALALVTVSLIGIGLGTKR